MRICGNMKEYEAEACWFLLVFGGMPEKKKNGLQQIRSCRSGLCRQKRMIMRIITIKTKLNVRKNVQTDGRLVAFVLFLVKNIE